jgi:hypothetical protein
MSDEVLPGTKYDNGVSIGRITEFRKTMAPGLQRDLLELKFLSDMPLSWYLKCHETAEEPEATQDLKYIEWIASKVEKGIKAEISATVNGVCEDMKADIEAMVREDCEDMKADIEAMVREDCEDMKDDIEASMREDFKEIIEEDFQEFMTEIHTVNTRMVSELERLEEKIVAKVQLLQTEAAETKIALEKDIIAINDNIYDVHNPSLYIILLGQFVILIIYAFITMVHYTAPSGNEIILFNREPL